MALIGTKIINTLTVILVFYIRWGGIYAIMFRPDYKKKPQTYKILYFGESDTFDTKLVKSHEKIPCWKKNSNKNALYASILKISIKYERVKIEKFLIKNMIRHVIKNILNFYSTYVSL